MWAFDLEKRQDRFRKGDEKPRPPREVVLPGGEVLELAPSKWNRDDFVRSGEGEHMAGEWVDVDAGKPEVMAGVDEKGAGVVAKKEL